MNPFVVTSFRDSAKCERESRSLSVSQGPVYLLTRHMKHCFVKGSNWQPFKTCFFTATISSTFQTSILSSFLSTWLINFLSEWKVVHVWNERNRKSYKKAKKKTCRKDPSNYVAILYKIILKCKKICAIWTEHLPLILILARNWSKCEMWYYNLYIQGLNGQAVIFYFIKLEQIADIKQSILDFKSLISHIGFSSILDTKLKVFYQQHIFIHLSRN